ncbi:MAG: phage tail protein, partial [Cyclobacteriaceae bacterium]|nr:phage tail protein [Cyclobacteriaceae bacterium]
MANNGTSQGAPWPMPKFRFSVDWGNVQTNISFQEVSGLDAETQIIEYRDSNSPIFSTVKMPGIAKYGNVTMKRGIFANDNLFWKWYSQIKMNTIQRQTVVIKLLDQTGATVVT